MTNKITFLQDSIGINLNQLICKLEDLANGDLTEGSDIYDHPCSVAIRAIESARDDIEYLKLVLKGKRNIDCKRAQVLIKTSTYTPKF